MRKVAYKGVVMNQAAWADFFGVTRGAITTRMIEHNETPEQAVRYFATRVGAEEKEGRMTSRKMLVAILAEIKRLNLRLGGAEQTTAAGNKAGSASSEAAGEEVDDGK